MSDVVLKYLEATIKDIMKDGINEENLYQMVLRGSQLFKQGMGTPPDAVKETIRSTLNDNKNFLIVELYDNDVAHIMRDGLKCAMVNYDMDLTDITKLKRFLVAYMVSDSIIDYACDDINKLIDFEKAKKDEIYLNKEMVVKLQRFAPTEDHDNGSAYVDLNTNEVYHY